MNTVLRRSGAVLASGVFRSDPAVRGLAQAFYTTRTAFPRDSESDSHDDFKPKSKLSSSKTVADVIDADVTAHAVFLYMKGVPSQPMCGFSNMAARILDAYGVQYGSRDVLSDPELREGIKEYTSWPMIPQVFIDGEFVGGSDILMEMHKSGELEEKLSKHMKQ